MGIQKNICFRSQKQNHLQQQLPEKLVSVVLVGGRPSALYVILYCCVLPTSSSVGFLCHMYVSKHIMRMN